MTLSRIEKMLMAAAGRNDMIVVVLLVDRKSVV